MRKSLMALPATAACLALALPTGIAAAQEEDDEVAPGYTPVTAEIIQEEACGQVTISYRNNNPLPFFGDYRVGAEEGTADEVTGDVIPEGPYEDEAFQRVFNAVELLPEQSTTESLDLAGEGTDGSVEVSAWVERGPEQRSFTLPVTETINTDCGQDDGSGGQDDGQGDGGQDDADQGSGDQGSGNSGQDDADSGDDSTGGSTDPDAVRPGGSYPVGGVETGGGPA